MNAAKISALQTEHFALRRQRDACRDNAVHVQITGSIAEVERQLIGLGCSHFE
jgi:hypothetical protein